MPLKVRDVNGVWYAWGKVLGRRVRQSTGYPVSTLAAKNLAQRKATDIELAIRSEHDQFTRTVPTVEAYWRETYRPTYTVQKRAPWRDDQMMAHALPVLGHRRLDQVKKSDCVRYLNLRRASMRANPTHKTPVRIAEGSVQRERGFLQGFFQRAVDDEIIDRNPWRTIERVDYEVRDRLVTEAEQALLLPRLSVEYQRFVRVLLGTGLRLDELRGIDPVLDLDLDERLIHVRERRDADGALITRVKGGRQRTVPIPVDVVDDFRQQLAEKGRLWTQEQVTLRKVLGDACRARKAKPARVSRRGKAVAAVEARIEIPRVFPHALRHTFGWRYLKAVGSKGIYALAQILGDTVAVTEKHYAKLLKEDLRDAVDRVDLGLGERKDGKVIPWPK